MDSALIEKVLSKNATLEEARLVAQWLATDEGQEYLSLHIDKEAFRINENALADWEDGKIPSGRMKLRFATYLKNRVRWFRFKVVAAVLLPLILLGGALLFLASRSGMFSNEMAEIVVPYGEQMHVLLQDGTLVQLNSGSSLQYPKSFGLFTRKVKLMGEAYFSVAKESARPFIVNLNDIDVKVTGTKFNTKAYSEDDRIVVSLDEGSVSIIDKKQNVYPLKAGENAVYDKATGLCTVNRMDDAMQHQAWKTNSLNFYRTPLSEILKTFERQYNVRFVVKDSSLMQFEFSISTNKINVNEVLDDMEKVSRIKFILNKANEYEVIQMK